MTRRATLRGAERVALVGDAARADVLICGASFAGLAVARELAGCGADVLVVDRYEIGERQTSACAAPTPWLEAMGVREAIRQELPCMAFHTPHGSTRFRLPWSWSSFDYRTLCGELWAQSDARFEIAKVEARAPSGPGSYAPGIEGGGDGASSGRGSFTAGIEGGGPGVSASSGRVGAGGGDANGARGGDIVVRTDRGDLCAPLVVDALGWRRVLGSGPNVQPPDAPISRGLEVHPDARGGDTDLDVWIDRSLIRRGYAWSVPAAREQRVGVGSYEPRDHVREPTVETAARLGLPPVRFQGNWFPHALRPAVEDGVFFAGDSAGHCFPLSGEGIRTAFYFGIACGRELRRVLEGSATREDALAAYGAFSASHARAFAIALWLQRLVPALPPRLLTRALALAGRERVCRRAFEWYLEQAHPRFASARPAAREARRAVGAPA